MINVMRQFGLVPDAIENGLMADNDGQLHNSSAIRQNGTEGDNIGGFFDNFTVEKMRMQGWTYHMVVTVIVSYAMYFGIGGFVHVSDLIRR